MIIVRTFTWEMAHRLQHHAGKCKELHGHSYKATVAIRGPVVHQNGVSDDGMVMDFAGLDAAMRKAFGFWDHATMLQSTDPLLSALAPLTRVHSVPWPPTAECIAQEIAKRVQDALGADGINITVVGVRVRQTENSCAVWEPR